MVRPASGYPHESWLVRSLRVAGGFLVGYLVSFVTSVGWFFGLTRRDPSDAASTGYILATAVFAIVFALVGGYVAAAIAQSSGRAAGTAIALFIVLVAAFSWFETPGRAHWSQLVAILLVAPAVIVGSRLKNTNAYAS